MDTKEKQRVKLFECIRDIPYRIPLNSSEEDHCCNGKTRQLKALLEKEGLTIRYRVCTFDWSALGVPDDILELSNKEVPTHVFLEVNLNGKWIQIDPTWDKDLKKALPIAKWDGATSTEIAVEPIEMFSTEESKEIMASCDPAVQDDEVEYENREFNIALNKWFEQNRR